MNDHDTPVRHTTAKDPEPGSSPAPAQSWGPTIWSRIKSLLALRTMSLRDDLQVALDEDGAGETSDFTESERAILQNVLKLGDTTVSDVMVPRADIDAIEAEATLGLLIAKFRQVGHSRLPVYDDNLDNLLGFIHVKDALSKITAPVDEPGKDVPVKLVSTALRHKIARLNIMRDVVFVPPLMPAGDLLQQMRASHVHMAIVVDEYGGTDGLVTIEDLLEAIVGDIEDEHDEAEASLIRKVGPDTYVADARAEIEDVIKIIGPDFQPGEYGEDIDTLGGLAFALIDRLPRKGEIISRLPGFDFEVLQADTRRIKRLRIKRSKRVVEEPQKLLEPPAETPADESKSAAAE